MSRLVAGMRTRGADEQGAVLMLTLGFLTCIAVITVALANYSTTSLRATVNLRDLRGAQVTAASAVDGAVNSVRFDQTKANSVGCFTATLNSITVRVDCSGATTGTDTTIALSGVLTSVTPNRQLIAAHVRFERSDPANVLVQVVDWSVKK